MKILYLFSGAESKEMRPLRNWARACEKKQLPPRTGERAVGCVVSLWLVSL